MRTFAERTATYRENALVRGANGHVPRKPSLKIPNGVPPWYPPPYPWRHAANRYDAAMKREAKQPALRQIVSGGQTGVDRGALDAAIALGIPHGGWCPAGRLAEDGQIPPEYALTESRSPDYASRTEQNVRDSDATLILYRSRLSGGTELTRRLAERLEKPYLLVDLANRPAEKTVLVWLEEHDVRDLNVAGPRESAWPGIAATVRNYLQQLFGPQ
jgi:hypothetical protein